MAKRGIDKLIREAQKRALALGGVLAILLALRTTGLAEVGFDRKRARLTIAGKPILLALLRRQLEALEGGLAKTIDLYAAKLEAGIWSLDQWADAMRALLRESHVLFAALAAGGLAAVAVPGSAAARTVAARSKVDERYLQKFKGDVKAGRAGTSPSIRRRAKAYLRSARITYQEVELELHRAAGYKEARRILTAEESCRRRGARIGCVEAWQRGWVKIDDMPPIGTLVCGQFCKCHVLYR